MKFRHLVRAAGVVGLTVIGSLVLSSCGSSEPTGAGDPGQTGLGKTGAEASGGGESSAECGVVFEQSAVDAYQASSEVDGRYLANPLGGVWRCSSSQTINGVSSSSELNGYSTLLVTPALKSTGTIEVTQLGNRNTESMTLHADSVSFTEDERANLAAQLKARKSYDRVTSLFLSRFSALYALVPGVPRYSAVSSQIKEGEKMVPAIEILTRAKSGAERAQFVENFQAGKVPLVLFGQNPLGSPSGVFQITTIYSENSSEVSAIRQVTFESGIQTLWARIPGGVYGDDFLRVELVDSVTRNLDYQNASRSGIEVRKAFSVIVEFAEPYWNANHTNLAYADALISYLEFLAHAEPSKETQPYLEKLQKIGPLMNGSNAALLTELNELVLQPKYTPEQEAAIVDFATGLKKEYGYQSAWAESKNLFNKVGRDPAKLLLTANFAKWLKSSEGGGVSASESMTRAMKIIGDKQASSETVAAYKGLLIWFQSTSGPGYSSYNATNETEKYLFSLNLGVERIELLKATYAWAVSSAGPDQSSYIGLNLAEQYVVKRMLSRESIQLVRTIFAWCKGPSGPDLSSYNALQKAESYVFEKQATEAKLGQLRALFSLYRKTMSSYSALERAEKEALL